MKLSATKEMCRRGYVLLFIGIAYIINNVLRLRKLTEELDKYSHICKNKYNVRIDKLIDTQVL